MPILGSDPTLHGLVYACGHFRNGILLAPVTAAAIADLVTGAKGTGSGADLKPFDIRRFDR